MKESRGIFIKPITLFILIIAAILGSATFADLLLSTFFPLSMNANLPFLGAGLMVIILFPVIYYLVYQPFTSYIKEINRSEEALQESEERYRSIVETTGDSIYLVNKNCDYLFMNSKHRVRMGIAFGGDYVGRAFGELHTPEATKEFCEKVHKIFETGEPLQQEYRSHTDDRYFLRTLSPVRGANRAIVAVSVVSKDITRLKKESEMELRYHAIFEQSPYGIVIIDTRGKMIDFNEQAHRDLGYSREEFSKLRIADIDPNETPEDIRARMQEVTKKGRDKFDVKHRTKGGDIRDVHVITQALNLSGETFFLAIWQDITERKP